MKSVVSKIAQLAEVAQLAVETDHWESFNSFYYQYIELIKNKVKPEYLKHTLDCAEDLFNRKYNHGPMYNDQIFSALVEDITK